MSELIVILIKFRSLCSMGSVQIFKDEKIVRKLVACPIAPIKFLKRKQTSTRHKTL